MRALFVITLICLRVHRLGGDKGNGERDINHASLFQIR